MKAIHIHAKGKQTNLSRKKRNRMVILFQFPLVLFFSMIDSESYFAISHSSACDVCNVTIYLAKQKSMFAIIYEPIHFKCFLYPDPVHRPCSDSGTRWSLGGESKLMNYEEEKTKYLICYE